MTAATAAAGALLLAGGAVAGAAGYNSTSWPCSATGFSGTGYNNQAYGWTQGNGCSYVQQRTSWNGGQTGLSNNSSFAVTYGAYNVSGVWGTHNAVKGSSYWFYT